MNKNQKIKVIELKQKKLTQKKIAEEVGATVPEVRTFLKELKEDVGRVVLDLVKPEPQPEPQQPSLLDMMKGKTENGDGGVIIMTEGVASLPPKRSTNSSRYKKAIFHPKGKS